MAPKSKPLSTRRRSSLELKVKLIHDKYLTRRTYGDPVCYGAMRELIKGLGPVAGKKLDYYYVHVYQTSLREAIRRRFVRYPGYAKKLNAMLQGRNPQSVQKAAWPAKSRAIAAKRLIHPKAWPKKLPPNIRIYQTSSSLYRPFKSWAQWYLLNYDVLQGGALSKAGMHISKPRSPFPESAGDPDYGDLEFFKDLHEAMSARFRDYNQKCDKGVWDPYFKSKSHLAKGRTAMRCLPRAQKLTTLFKTANKGEAAKNMLKTLGTEVKKLKEWKETYPK